MFFSDIVHRRSVGLINHSINQSVFIWIRQKPIHTDTHACTKHNIQ